MKNLRWLLACGALATASLAQAGITGTVTATSDYDFRGLTQTALSPALQASIDYAADNGFYAGAWASNIDFGSCCGENVELDLYGGWTHSSENGLGYSLNAIYYTYPGAKIPESSPGAGDSISLNFPEVSAGISYKMFSGKLWYSWNWANTDMSATYLEGNLNFSLPHDFGLAVHAGYSSGDYWDTAKTGGYGEPYFDYSVGVTKTLGHFNCALKFIDGSDNKLGKEAADLIHDLGGPSDIFTSKSKVVFSVATTFPWSNE